MLSSPSSYMKCELQHTNIRIKIKFAPFRSAIVRESSGCIGHKSRVCRAGNTGAVERDTLLNEWSDDDTDDDHASTDANQWSD
jgi:hypothetical protein